jgi:hypothetical protein
MKLQQATIYMRTFEMLELLCHRRLPLLFGYPILICIVPHSPVFGSAIVDTILWSIPGSSNFPGLQRVKALLLILSCDQRLL